MPFDHYPSLLTFVPTPAFNPIPQGGGGGDTEGLISILNSFQAEHIQLNYNVA